jgi:hypothetical protein
MLLLAVFGLVGMLRAQSLFDGTWKFDTSQGKLQQKPYTWIIQNGTYQCSVCPFFPGMTVNIRADGTDQPVQGSKIFDQHLAKELDLSFTKLALAVRILQIRLHGISFAQALSAVMGPQ